MQIKNVCIVVVLVSVLFCNPSERGNSDTNLIELISNYHAELSKVLPKWAGNTKSIEDPIEFFESLYCHFTMGDKNEEDENLNEIHAQSNLNDPEFNNLPLAQFIYNVAECQNGIHKMENQTSGEDAMRYCLTGFDRIYDYTTQLAFVYACGEKLHDIIKKNKNSCSEYFEEKSVLLVQAREKIVDGTHYMFGDRAKFLDFLRDQKISLQSALGDALLEDSVWHSNVAFVKLLLEYGVNANAFDGKMLTKAICAHKNNLELVQLLLQHGYNLDECNELVLHSAMHSDNNVQLMPLLLEYGVNPDEIDSLSGNSILKSVLRMIRESSRIEILQLLLENGANQFDADDVSFLRGMLLHDCEKHVPILQLFLDYKENLSIQAQQELLLLLDDVIRRENVNVVQLLLDHKIDPNGKNKESEPLIFSALDNDKVEILQLLLSVGADVHSVDNEGKSILEQAIWHKKNDVMLLLLQSGADVTMLSKELIEDITLNNRVDIFEGLLIYGFNPTEVQMSGVSLLDYVTNNKKDYVELRKLFTRQGYVKFSWFM